MTYSLTDFSMDINEIAEMLPEAISHARGYQAEDGSHGWAAMLDYADRLQSALDLIKSMPDEVKKGIDLAERMEFPDD